MRPGLFLPEGGPVNRRVNLEAPGQATILAARHLDIQEGAVQVGTVVNQSTRSAITQVLDYVAEAHNSEPDQSRDQLVFITRVMEIFSLSHADAYGDVLWRVDDGELKLYANVSDVFHWGSSDVEEIPPESLDALETAYAELKAVGAEEFTAELYAARRRCMRPQGASYPSRAHDSWRKVHALYDACGPERSTGLGNPKKKPV